MSSLNSSRDRPDVDAGPVFTIAKSMQFTPLSGVARVVRNPTIPRGGKGNEKANEVRGLIAGIDADHRRIGDAWKISQTFHVAG